LRFRASAPALIDDGLEGETNQGLSASPSLRASGIENHRIERRDYSAMVLLLPNKGTQQNPNQDYSDEPPSSAANNSRCTALYGPIA
jgi:hypothetical protein